VTELSPRLPEHAEEAIHSFLKSHSLYHGNEGAVIGLSGGIDSALVARLARDALGPHRVLGVLLPDQGYPPALVSETETYARSLGIDSRTIPLSPIEVAYRTLLPEVTDRVTIGNTVARMRMTVLYALAREHRRVVLGTGNKSEILLGYFTKYGDGGVDVLPIGDLYKTQVRALAARLDLPRPVRERPPTAGLWEGQTDEAELGAPYERLDRILYGIELGWTEEEIARGAGEALAMVRSVAQRVTDTRHKRRLPPIPKLGEKTVGIDWSE
jgi:NAD+ synthase